MTAIPVQPEAFAGLQDKPSQILTAKLAGPAGAIQHKTLHQAARLIYIFMHCYFHDVLKHGRKPKAKPPACKIGWRAIKPA